MVHVTDEPYGWKDKSRMVGAHTGSQVLVPSELM